MTEWPAVRARRVLVALQRTGWRIARQRGSHRVLVKEGRPNFVFAFKAIAPYGPGLANGEARVFKAAVHNGLFGRKLRNAICLSEARWPPQILVCLRALHVRSNSPGNCKSNCRMSIWREMEAVML